MFEDQINLLEAVGGKLTNTVDNNKNKTTIMFRLDKAPQLLYFSEEVSN